MKKDSLESRLIEKGITQGDLTEFARLPLHNAKEDIFRAITGVKSADELHDPFFKDLLLTLADLGIENRDKFFPQHSEANFRNMAGQLVANQMLGTLNSRKYQQYEEVTLNTIYQDTFEITE